VSVDTTMVSSGIETIDVDDEEGDVESPSATVAQSAGTPHRVASPATGGGDTPPDVKDSRAPQVEH
jgi:hypothetical protein